MAHTSRLATRKSSTPVEWLKTCSHIGEVANTWAGRGDLAVYGGADAGMGEAIACFITDTAEIEINLPKAFGKATTPEMVGDLRERDVQYDWAEPVGVIYHEALHARFTTWNMDEVHKDLDKSQSEAFMLLEESRIEGLGAKLIPSNKLFLRSSALGLSIGDMAEVAEKMSEVWATANLAGLALARVDVGVLEPIDVAPIHDKIEEILGAELLEKLRSVWVRFQVLTTAQIVEGKALAKEWVELLRQADPEGEQGSGEGMPQALQDLLEALGEAAGDTAVQVSIDMGDQQDAEERKAEAESKAKESKRQSESQQEAKEVFTRSNGSTGSGSSSRLQEQRNPTGTERAAAVQIAKMLEQAKYRERSMTEIKSHAPQGRLKTRVAIQNAASKSRGVRETQPAWIANKRKHTDDPTLSIGVMVDISGSMSSAMEAMATTAWVMGEAGRRVQAKTAMVYYGSGVFSTLKVGQKLDKVSVYTAPDGTEKFDKAFKALDGELNLTYGEGVRLLVIVSDGHYTSAETEKAVEAARLCERSGVAVVWISPEACYGSRGEAILKGTSGVVLDRMKTDDIALAIGKAAASALGKIGAKF